MLRSLCLWPSEYGHAQSLTSNIQRGPIDAELLLETANGLLLTQAIGTIRCIWNSVMRSIVYHNQSFSNCSSDFSLSDMSSTSPRTDTSVPAALGPNKSSLRLLSCLRKALPNTPASRGVWGSVSVYFVPLS